MNIELCFSGLKRPFFIFTGSLMYAIVVLSFSDDAFNHSYTATPYHRLQADALLNGKLSIGDSIYQIKHDLAWHDGQVNQIWGLGVSLWLVPFELLWRILGLKWFPDRVALAFAFGLLAWYSGITAWHLANKCRRPAVGFSLLWLTIMCPALWTLNFSPLSIYEETTLYACLISLGILTSVVSVACFCSRRDFIICAFLSAASAVVRPTHGIYGLVAMLVCSIIVSTRRRWMRTIFLGNGVFVAGLAFLAVTNWSRFGSPLEFGHRLSVTPGIIVFMTRMENPMRHASGAQAARELFGWLFLAGNTYDLDGSRKTGVPGEAPQARWRDFYLRTFDLTWIPILILACAGNVNWVWQRKKANWNLRGFLVRPAAHLTIGLFVWGFLCSLTLFGFYLYFPCLSSRYLLDFAPAFAGLVFLGFLHMLYLFPRCSPVLIALWFGYELARIQSPGPFSESQSRRQVPDRLSQAIGVKIDTYGGIYNLAISPQATEIPYNGYGWNDKDGKADEIIILAIDRPQFVELIVETNGSQSDVYQAMMDAQFLPLHEIRAEGDRTRVVFDIPEKIRRRAGDELLFLFFRKGYDKEDRESKRPLYSVHWR